MSLKPGLHKIVTVGDASPRQAQVHIGDSCVKWKHFLSDVSDVADQTGTVRGRIERAEMSLKPGFHLTVTVIVSICRRLIGDTLSNVTSAIHRGQQCRSIMTSLKIAERVYQA